MAVNSQMQVAMLMLETFEKLNRRLIMIYSCFACKFVREDIDRTLLTP